LLHRPYVLIWTYQSSARRRSAFPCIFPRLAFADRKRWPFLAHGLTNLALATRLVPSFHATRR
jgi:hypothetical protein